VRRENIKTASDGKQYAIASRLKAESWRLIAGV